MSTEIATILTANIDEFKAKMGEAEVSMKTLSDSGTSNLSKLSGVGKGLLMGLTASAIGVGVAAVDFGDKLELSQSQLQAALKATGTSWSSVKDSVSATGGAATKYGYTQAQVDAALTRGVISTKSYTGAHKNLSVAIQLAAAKHVDLNTAMGAVDKATQGNTRALMQLGISLPIVSSSALKLKEAHDKLSAAQLISLSYLKEFPDAVDVASSHHAAYETTLDNVKVAQGHLNDQQGASTAILDALSGRLSGQATAAADTFQGRLDGMKAKGENLAAQIGLQLIPVLEGLVTDIENVVTWFDKHKTAAEVLGGVLAALATGAIAVYIVNVGTNMVQATQRALTSLGLLDGGLETTGAVAVTTAGEVEGVGVAAGDAGMAGGLAEGEGAATGLTGVLGPLAVGVGIVTLGAMALSKAINNSAAPAWETLGQQASKMSGSTLPQLTLKIATVKQAQEDATKAIGTGSDTLGMSSKAAQAYGAELDTLRSQQSQMTANIQILSSTLGISKSQVQEAAQALGINLAQALTRPEVNALNQQLQQMGVQADTAGSQVQGMSANAVAALTVLASKLKSTGTAADWGQLGQDIDFGIGNGITANSGVVVNAAAGMVQAVITKSKTGLKAASPSKVFAEIGTWIPQGLAQGIDSASPAAAASIQRMTTSLLNATNLNSPGVTSPFTGSGLGGGSSVPAGGGGGGAGAPLIIQIDGNAIAHALLTPLQVQGALLQRTQPQTIFGVAQVT